MSVGGDSFELSIRIPRRVVGAVASCAVAMYLLMQGGQLIREDIAKGICFLLAAPITLLLTGDVLKLEFIAKWLKKFQRAAKSFGNAEGDEA